MVSQEDGLKQVCVPLGELVRGRYVDRPNRFRVDVALANQRVAAYLANPGRLEELLVPGCHLWLRPAHSANRRTDYDVVLAEHLHGLVSLNSHLPNALIHQALKQGWLDDLNHFPVIQTEVKLGQSRLDFRLLTSGGRRHWIEVKSVTLVQRGVAEFPDAPTARGRRHLHELMEAVDQGDEATIIFLVQRGDAVSFAPHDMTDPDFGRALRAAAKVGVAARAIRCVVSQKQICLDRELPVSLDAPSS